MCSPLELKSDIEVDMLIRAYQSEINYHKHAIGKASYRLRSKEVGNTAFAKKHYLKVIEEHDREIERIDNRISELQGAMLFDHDK